MIAPADTCCCECFCCFECCECYLLLSIVHHRLLNYCNSYTYTYLGVDITPTLNWSYQLRKTIATVKDRGLRMAGCMLSYRQKLHFVKTVIVPAATYAFPLAYLTPADLAKLDSLYSRICKQALGLPTCTTTALVWTMVSWE